MGTVQDILREKRYFEKLYARNSHHHFIIDRYQEIHLLTVDRLASGSRILDLGCGSGHHSRAFARKGLDVTGIDLAKGAIQFCRDSFAQDGLTGEFHIGDIQQLPFVTKNFDACFLSLILHHFRDHGRVLEEAARVCADYLFVFEPNSWNPQSFALFNLVNPLFKPRFLTPNQRAVNPRAVENTLERCGFRPLETHFVTIGSTSGKGLQSFVYGAQRLLPPALRHN